MKKIILSVLFASSCLVSFMAQNSKVTLKEIFLMNKDFRQNVVSINRGEVTRPLKSNNFNWNVPEWINSDSSYYEYSNQGLLLKETQKSNGSINSISLYTYNDDNKQIGSEYKYYNSDSLFAGYKYIQLFDVRGNEIEYRFENWNTASKSWDLTSGTKKIRTYNSKNLNTETIRQEYIDSLSIYVNESKDVLTYDSKNNLVLEETFIWDGTKWINYSKGEYTYDLNNVLTSLTWYEWNNGAFLPLEKITDIVWDLYSANWMNEENIRIKSYFSNSWNGSTWIQDYRYSAAYDSFGGYKSLGESYENGQWVNDNRVTVLYDSNLNHIENTEENWVNNKWEISYQNKSIYTYDSNNNMTKKIEQNWDSNSSQLMNIRRYDYSDYKSFTTTGIEETKSNILAIYPNPFTTEFNVKMENEYLNYIFVLADLSGKQLFSSEAKGSANYNMESLNSGYYIYSIISNNQLLETGKLLKH